MATTLPLAESTGKKNSIQIGDRDGDQARRQGELQGAHVSPSFWVYLAYYDCTDSVNMYTCTVKGILLCSNYNSTFIGVGSRVVGMARVLALAILWSAMLQY